MREHQAVGRRRPRARDLEEGDVGHREHAHRGRHQRDAQAARDQREDRLHLRGLLHHLRQEARRLAGAEQRGDEARALRGRERDEGFGRQRLDLHRTLRRQRMAARHGDHELLRLQVHQHQPARFVDRAHHQRELDLALAQVLELARGGLGREAQLHGRVVVLEALEDRGQHVERGARHEREPQRALEPLRRAARALAGRLGLLQQALRVLVEDLARGREPHVVPAAVEQHRAELLLEIAHRHAQRRLRHVEPDRGAAEVQFLGQHHELAQLSEFEHGRGDSCGE